MISFPLPKSRVKRVNPFPLLACHLATIHARRMVVGIMAFVLILLGIAMHYAGWFDSAASQMGVGWILMLIVCYALLYLFIADDSGRDSYFKALGMYRKWCWSQAIVHILFMLPLTALWGTALFCALDIAGFGIAGIMLMFEIVFAQATMVSLQPRFTGLSKSKKLALMGVISGPWILTAWLLGLFASKALLFEDSAWAFIVGLALLGGIQTALSSFGET